MHVRVAPVAVEVSALRLECTGSELGGLRAAAHSLRFPLSHEGIPGTRQRGPSLFCWLRGFLTSAQLLEKELQETA